MRRELDARTRQTGAAGDPGRALADRLALLDRPAFAGFFDAIGDAHRRSRCAPSPSTRCGSGSTCRSAATTEASRLITRLLLAQFTRRRARQRTALFACLVLDDATGTVTADRCADCSGCARQNAGVVLALRSLDDVPEALHGPLLRRRRLPHGVLRASPPGTAAVRADLGHRVGGDPDVAKHTVFADQPLTSAIHALRKLVTGKAVTTEAVTVRQVERERWSASELAHEVPPGTRCCP